MDFSKPLHLAIASALLISVCTYLFDRFGKKDTKDMGEYLRVFSFSGIIILGLTHIKSSKKTLKTVSNNQIHTGTPGF